MSGPRSQSKDSTGNFAKSVGIQSETVRSNLGTHEVGYQPQIVYYRHTVSVVSALSPHTSGLEELLNSDWLSVRKGSIRRRSELGSCVKVEPGWPSWGPCPYGLCGCKATLKGRCAYSTKLGHERQVRSLMCLVWIWLFELMFEICVHRSLITFR